MKTDGSSQQPSRDKAQRPVTVTESGDQETDSGPLLSLRAVNEISQYSENAPARLGLILILVENVY